MKKSRIKWLNPLARRVCGVFVAIVAVAAIPSIGVAADCTQDGCYADQPVATVSLTTELSLGDTQWSGAVLLDATQRTQDMQISFDMAYLQLQSQMQNENRSFTLVSNFMRTKHDTVKNSIDNVR